MKEKLKRLTERIFASTSSQSLTTLGKIYRTDKIGRHNYLVHYEEHLKKFRNKKFNLLEIGVGGYDNPNKGGKSLRMWKQYFPKAHIYSIDIHDKSGIEENRISIYQGSQVDESFMKKVIDKAGDFDIIIDDGSHVNAHVIKSFEILFPVLNMGGVYIVEDTQTSYWPEYGGSSDIADKSQKTMMSYFQHLTHGLNHKEYLLEDYQPSYYDQHITSIHFYHNLIIMHKGLNDETSNILRN